jgi:hypothetical protein
MCSEEHSTQTYKDSNKLNQNPPFCHPKINFHIILQSTWDTTISRATKPWADRSGVKISAAARDPSLLQTSRPAPAPNQPLTQWVPADFSLAVKQTGCKSNTQLHLMPWLRMSGSTTPTPCVKNKLIYNITKLCACMLCTATTSFHLHLPSTNTSPKRALPFMSTK